MASDITRVVFASDLHNCHIDWYGVPTHARLDGFVEKLNAYHAAHPVDAVLLLGDYALDFWQWEIGGSYVHHRVSNTRAFFEDFASRLPNLACAIPGNHEQYSDADFFRFTGFHRRGFVSVKGNLFILLDNFAANLNPHVDSDGTYTPSDVSWARSVMDAHPGERVFLCAHHFDYPGESEAFRGLVRDERVVALFQGHTHKSRLIPLGPEFGNKYICQTGNYAYSIEEDGPAASFWGWRELVVSESGVETSYYTPENEAVLDGSPYRHPAGRQDILTIGR